MWFSARPCLWCTPLSFSYGFLTPVTHRHWQVLTHNSLITKNWINFLYSFSNTLKIYILSNPLIQGFKSCLSNQTQNLTELTYNKSYYKSPAHLTGTWSQGHIRLQPLSLEIEAAFGIAPSIPHLPDYCLSTGSTLLFRLIVLLHSSCQNSKGWETNCPSLSTNGGCLETALFHVFFSKDTWITLWILALGGKSSLKATFHCFLNLCKYPKTLQLIYGS